MTVTETTTANFVNTECKGETLKAVATSVMEGVKDTCVESTLTGDMYGNIVYETKSSHISFGVETDMRKYDLQDAVDPSELSYDYETNVSKYLGSLYKDYAKKIQHNFFTICIEQRENGKRKWQDSDTRTHDFDCNNYRLCVGGVCAVQYKDEGTLLKAVAECVQQATACINAGIAVEKLDNLVQSWRGDFQREVDINNAWKETVAATTSSHSVLKDSGFTQVGERGDSKTLFPSEWRDCQEFSFRKSTGLGIIEVKNTVDVKCLEKEEDVFEVTLLKSKYTVSLATTQSVMEKAQCGGALTHWDFNTLLENQTLDQVLEFVSNIK